MLKVSKMRSTRLKIIEPLSETEIHTISKGKTDLRVAQTKLILFLKWLSEWVGSDIERLWILKIHSISDLTFFDIDFKNEVAWIRTNRYCDPPIMSFFKGKWKKKLGMRKKIERIESSKRRSKDKQNRSSVKNKLKVNTNDNSATWWWTSAGINLENVLSFESGSCSATFAPWIDQKAKRKGRLWKTHSRIGSFRTRRERKSKWKGINTVVNHDP